MRGIWKAGLAIVAVLVLAGTAVGFVSAQTDGEVPGSGFVSRLAEKLGISQEELEAAIDETQLDLVDEAVADGKLDEERAEAVRDRIESGEGFGRFGKGPGMGHGMDRGPGHLGASLDDLAGFLEISVEELRDAMADGQTLAEVAEAQGTSVEDLKPFLLARLEERLAEAVESGRITQERADEVLANAPERIEEMINKVKPNCTPGGEHRGPWGGGPPADAEPEGSETSF